MSNTPFNSESPIQQGNMKKNNDGRNVVITCAIVFICLICLCCSAVIFLIYTTFGGVVAAFDQVGGSVNTLCTSNTANLRTVYENSTSREFKASTSFSEFQSFFNKYKDVILDCSKISRDGWFQTIINGVQLDYARNNADESFNIKYPSQGKTVEMILVNEGGSWKINSIEVL